MNLAYIAGLFESHAWVLQGMTQRNKKFLSIGCMRFVGKQRIALIKWAKAKVARG
jgi:hypothetical protein